VRPEQVAAARALKPMHERQMFGQTICCLIEWSGSSLPRLGKCTHRALRDLFVAVMGNAAGEGRERSGTGRGAMNPEAKAAPLRSAEAVRTAPRTVTASQTFYWCVRRELWGIKIPVGLPCAYRGGRSVSVWLFVEHSAFAAADARGDGQSSSDEESGRTV